MMPRAYFHTSENLRGTGFWKLTVRSRLLAASFSTIIGLTATSSRRWRSRSGDRDWGVTWWQSSRKAVTHTEAFPARAVIRQISPLGEPHRKPDSFRARTF